MKKIITLILALVLIMACALPAYAAIPAAAVPEAQIKYLALGDSVLSGVLTADASYDRLGRTWPVFGDKIKSAFPYMISEKLYGDDAYDSYYPCSVCASYVDDWIYLLAEDDTKLIGTDTPATSVIDGPRNIREYTDRVLMDNYMNGLGYTDDITAAELYEDLRAFFLEKIPQADVISLNIGGNVVSSFLYDLATEIVSPCGDDFTDFYGDPLARAILENFKSSYAFLKESDNESYQYLYNALCNILHWYYAGVNGTRQLLCEINDLNPDAEVYYFSVYNPFYYYTYSNEYVSVDIGELSQPIFDLYNIRINQLCAESSGQVHYVNIDDVELFTRQYIEEGKLTEDDVNCAVTSYNEMVTSPYGIYYSTHPSDAGHEYITEQFMKVYNSVHGSDASRAVTGLDAFNSALKALVGIKINVPAVAECLGVEINNAVSSAVSECINTATDIVNNWDSYMESFITGVRDYQYNQAVRLQAQVKSQLETATEQIEKYFHLDPVIIVK